MAMKLDEFNKIEKLIVEHTGLSRECFKILTQTFPHIKYETLQSIISYYARTKTVKSKLLRLRKRIIDEYHQNIKANEPPGIILRLSVKYDFVPTILARLLIEDYLNENDLVKNQQVMKTKTNKLLKDSTLINNADLAYEVYLCVLNDDYFGPISDAAKHCIGLEYEQRLVRIARENKLIFQDEEFLRKDGYDKTPDIKLDVPIAVNGTVISWIESKALFGHPKLHEGYEKDQYISYWNRFGTGLIIYWFGYLETIVNPLEKRFIISDRFPDNITHMDPKSIEVDLNKTV
ncbi:CDAN1-interacting nuclease 1 [Chrysoperla carnea]|uniref:CDAN1-interacting nuclease 1 n=1 Tax=Chrysoperla carnea TaxID=189513 RepID=UPI001D066E90|nr:CDAN1-interacting nuclease 1 [Chrysoperla carnea]